MTNWEARWFNIEKQHMSFAKLKNFGKEKNILLDHPLIYGVPTLSEQTGLSWALPGILLVR